MTRIVLCAVVLSIAGGCSSTEHCPSESPHLIKVEFAGEPAYVGYRAGDAPWKQVEDGEFCVANEYALAVVCMHESGTVEVYQHLSTANEETHVFAPTCYTQTYLDNAVSVTGEIEDAAWVYLGDDNVFNRAAGPWAFELGVQPGQYDLVATSARFGAAGRVVIRPGLDISGPTTLAIDLAAGWPTSDVPIVVENVLPTDMVSTTLAWEKAADRPSYEVNPTLTEADGAVARVLVGATDEIRARLIVNVSAQSQGIFRRVARRTATDAPLQTSFVLPDPGDGVTYKDDSIPTVQWATLPSEYTAVGWTIVRDSEPKLVNQLRASRGWIELTTSSMLGMLDNPEISSAWIILSQDPSRRLLTIEGGSLDEDATLVVRFSTRP